MSEVKSTLQLVLEKTRNMALSEEERQEQAMREFRERLNGLLHEYLEGLANLDQFQRQFSSLEAVPGSRPEEVLAEEVVQRMEVHEDHEKLLEILSRLCGTELDRVERLLLDHRNRLRDLQKERTAQLQKALKDRFQIHGTAVRPNLAADSHWAQSLSQARKAFGEEVKREVFSQMKS